MELTELIESVDILDYISQFADFEERNGEFWALSPLKEEATPSFSVREETNSFYDFSSGIGGNVLTFIRYYFKCNYAEAIKKLKEFAGYDENTVIAKSKKISAVQVAKKFKPAPQKQKKAITSPLPDNYMDMYEDRRDKLAVWESEGISLETLKKFQVKYDSFSNRLVYPIRNVSGQIVNIGGRTLDLNWKTKGLRKYTYFKKWGEMNTIYGLAENIEEIQKKKEIILFEGCKSVLIMDTWGFHNAAALLTSHLNPNQFKILAGLGCRVVFALDKEINIHEDFNIKKLKQFVNVEYLWDKDRLLDEKDSPVDKGLEVWKKLYEGRLMWR